MISCPKCAKKVPTRSVWTGSGLAGVVCPHCNASLWPVYWRTALLLAAALASGQVVIILLRRAGIGFPFDLLALVVTILAVYAVLMPVVLRLRVKESGFTTLPSSRA